MTLNEAVWDPLVRIGHWTIVAAFAIAYFTEDDLLTLHVWAGYTVGAVVVIRIAWGFVGPARARFSDFIYAPRTIIAYLSDLARLRGRRYLGHSPAGGAMVVALLAMLTATVVTGLMTYGADKKAGPLATFYTAGEPLPSASLDGSHKPAEESAIREVHDLLADLTLVLVLVHVAGVALASVVHHENLVRAMITGRKRTDTAH
ncbi:MAG TPA: cytochrome b/b6 domain-containing protein [Stellaceae bacterium]|nr:cytochrome b/b6 domain-containing protein [Stellaceae bacterium]